VQHLASCQLPPIPGFVSYSYCSAVAYQLRYLRLPDPGFTNHSQNPHTITIEGLDESGTVLQPDYALFRVTKS